MAPRFGLGAFPSASGVSDAATRHKAGSSIHATRSEFYLRGVGSKLNLHRRQRC